MPCVRLFLLQSAHILFGSSLSSDLSVAWFLACLSAAGLGGRLDMVRVRERARARMRVYEVRSSGWRVGC